MFRGLCRRTMSGAAAATKARNDGTRVPKYGQYFIPTVDESVNFQVGQPAPSMLPLEMIRECTAEKMAETDPLILQYGYISGYVVQNETHTKPPLLRNVYRIRTIRDTDILAFERRCPVF